MNRKLFYFWLGYFLTSQVLFWYGETHYVPNRGNFYLTPDYRGLFFSDVLYTQKPGYTAAWILAYHLGGLLALPALVHLARLPKPEPVRDYTGNWIGPWEWKTAMHHYKRFRESPSWTVHSEHRNHLFLGLDLVTGKPVFLEDEALFSGILVIGKQGTGKTASFFKTILKQLAQDPKDKTAFAVFTKKEKDTREFMTFLQGHGKSTLPWSMASILNLALNTSGGFERGQLQALLQGACGAAGLTGEGSDPFWLNTAVERMTDYLFALAREGQYITWGKAYAHFTETVRERDQKGKAEMDRGLLATLSAVFGPMLDPTSRLSILHSPHQDGGLHVGPLWAAPHTTIRVLEPSGAMHEETVGNNPRFFEAGVFELPPKARLPFDWSTIFRPASILFPPFGSSKGEQWALCFAKQTLLAWIAQDIASPHSRLLVPDPANRFRTVIAQDEGHNFLHLGAEGITDTQANQENREAGMINLIASQSMAAVAKGKPRENKAFFSVNGANLFLGVNGPERGEVLDTIGKVTVRKIETSFSKSEGTGKSAGGTSGNQSDRIAEKEEYFISRERYGRLPQGVAILVVQGEPHRLIYCPLHNRVRFQFRGEPS